MQNKELQNRREFFKETKGRQFFRVSHRKLLISSCIIVFFSSLFLISCKKKPDGEITVTTKSVTDITTNSAKCGGTVSYTGGFTIGDCGVCYNTSSYPTERDGYTKDQYGDGSFNSTIDNLESGTKYYVRAYAKTSSGIMYGNQESFTTKENPIWLYYGDGVLVDHWGLTNGGDWTWAVMFPSSMLTTYTNKKINKIKMDVGKIGTYTVSIYSGGSSSPTTLLYSKDYSVTSTGMTQLEVSPMVSLTTSQNLWISVTNIHDAGDFPAGASEGINNSNARWCCYNGTWYDVINNNGGTDICWMIQALLSNGTDKEGDAIVLLPPPSYPISSCQQDIPSCNNSKRDNSPRCADYF